jgi:hypothetical protein
MADKNPWEVVSVVPASQWDVVETAPTTTPTIAPKSKYVNLMSLLPPKEENPLPGIYMGATDPFYAGGRLAMETGLGDKQAMDKAIAERFVKYQAGRQNKGFDTNRLAGNILSPPNIALTMALPESLVATVPRLLATGSVLGAGTSLMNPVTEPAQQKDYGETLKSNMMMGGMLGPVFQGGA